MTLKNYRIKSGLKVIYIAKELGISRAQYRNYELGIHKPPVKRIDKLSKLFNISYEELEIAWEEGKKCHYRN